MSHLPSKIIIMGPPASGKDTQAEFLVKEIKAPIIAVGVILRKEAEKKTAHGRLFKKTLEEGGLLPSETVNKIVGKKIKHLKKFILDGFPRDLAQAEFLDKINKIDVVLNVHISDKEAIKRISGRRVCAKCGESYHLIFKKPKSKGVCDVCGGSLKHRDDDKPKVISNRLSIYHKRTEPLIKYYKKQKKLITINGKQSIQGVRGEIAKRLKIQQIIMLNAKAQMTNQCQMF